MKTSNEFSYLWGKDKVTPTPEPRPAAKATKITTPDSAPQKKAAAFGLPSAIGSFLIMLVAQVIVVVIVLILFPDLISTDPNEPISANLSPVIIFLSSLSMYVAWIGAMAWVTKKRGTGSWKQDFWLAIKPKDFIIGPAVALGMFLLLQGISFLFNTLGIDMSGADNASAFGPGTGIGGLLIAIFIATLAGPIAEEFFFRGHVMHGVSNSLARVKDRSALLKGAPSKFATWLDAHKWILAAIVSSVWFGLMHTTGSFEGFSSVFLMLATGTLGFVMALLVLKTKRLGTALTTHVFYNGITLLSAYVLTALGVQ